MMRQHGTALASEIASTKRRLFFIVGSGRCGTTLVRAVMNAHPSICIPVETHFYNTYRRLNYLRYGNMSARAYERALREIRRWTHVRNESVDWALFHDLANAQQTSWHALFVAFLTAYRLDQGKGIVGEKTPGHIRYLRELHEAFPDARFIHLIRDPRAVVASYLGHTFYRKVYGDNIVRAVAKWREAAVAHHSALETIPQSHYHAEFYEDLVAQPTRVMESIFGFLGIEFDATLLDSYGRSSLLVGNPANHGLVGTRITDERTERWKSTLSQRQLELTEWLLKPEMDRLGYTASRSHVVSCRWEAARAMVESRCRFIAFVLGTHRQRYRGQPGRQGPASRQDSSAGFSDCTDDKSGADHHR